MSKKGIWPVNDSEENKRTPFLQEAAAFSFCSVELFLTLPLGVLPWPALSNRKALRNSCLSGRGMLRDLARPGGTDPVSAQDTGR